jgi:hypothetical protein
MNAALIAVLINTIGIPELTTWLRGLHASGTPVTDAVILQKLITDTNFIESVGNAWLAAHPVTPPPAP